MHAFIGAMVGWWMLRMWLRQHGEHRRHHELLAAIAECRPPSKSRLMFEEYVRAGFTEAYDRGFEDGVASREPKPTSLEQLCAAISAVDVPPRLRAITADRG